MAGLGGSRRSGKATLSFSNRPSRDRINRPSRDRILPCQDHESLTPTSLGDGSLSPIDCHHEDQVAQAACHSVDNLRRFGPLSGVSSEIFENLYTVTRAVLIHSNRRAPSRDIGREFAVQEAVRHVVRWSFFEEDGIWRQGGSAVLSLMKRATL